MPRYAGTPNRNKQFLISRLKDMYGKDFNPIMQMAKNCVVLQEIANAHCKGKVTLKGDQVIDASNSAKTAIDAWDKVAQYVESKLKAIEVTGPEGERVLPSNVRILVQRVEEEEEKSPEVPEQNQIEHKGD